MSHNTTNIASLLQSCNFGGGDEYFEQIKKDRWKLWLDMGIWDYRQALCLLACEPQPCQSITECMNDFEDKFRNMEFYPDDLYACFYRQINNITSKIYAVFTLYQAERWSLYGFPDDNYPEHISPAKFIEWALSKAALDVPQEMVDWYNTYKSRRKSTSKSALADTPKVRKRQNEITQKIAAQKLGVSERTIRNWDKGRYTPDRYPGRGKLTAFLMFLVEYKAMQSLTADARQQNRALPAGDMHEYADTEVSEEE